MEKKIFVTAAFIGLIWCSAIGQSDFDKKLNTLYKHTVPLIHANELSKKLDGTQKIILLDTRSAVEYKSSHLQNADFVNYDAFTPSAVAGLDKDSQIIVYCTVGYRSERIGEKLIKMGFKNVKNLYGGIFDWVNTGHSVVNPLGAVTDSVHTYNKDWSRWLLKGIKVY